MADEEAKKDRIGRGYRLPGEKLRLQALATLKKIREDLQALIDAEILEEKEVEEAEATLAKVAKGLQDRTIVEAEARALTEGQTTLVRQVKVDRRKLIKSASRALRRTSDLKDFGKSTARSSGVPAIVKDMNAKLAIVARNAAKFAKKGAPRAFVAAVTQRVAELEAAELEQEAAIENLPKKMRDFCEQKGLLHEQLQDLHAAGWTLYADDVEEAAKYNMKILYKRAAKKKGKGKGNGEGNGK